MECSIGQVTEQVKDTGAGRVGNSFRNRPRALLMLTIDRESLDFRAFSILFLLTHNGYCLKSARNEKRMTNLG